MKVRYAVVVFGVAALLGAWGDARVSAQSPALRAAMREKLANTQSMLEAVVRSDFEGIARYAEPLSRISENEISLWQTPSDPTYSQQATLFLLSVRGLREAAEARNIDSAALEYSTLISSCIRCHTHVQNVRNVRLDLPPASPFGVPGR
jgi:hypothetical protein